MEEQIQRQERMLARAEQIAGMGSWRWDVGANTVIWSAELYRIHGVEPGTPITYETFLARVHPDDRERVRAIVAASLEHHQPFRYDERIVRPDGQVRWLDSQGEVELDAAGRPMALFGFCRDVTEQKRAADALREREERFAKIFHASPVATCLSRAADGRILDVNARFVELIGYPRGDLIGKRLHEFGFWAKPQERKRVVAQMRKGGSLSEVQVTYRTRDGQAHKALAAIERIELDRQDCWLKMFWRA